MTHISWIDSQPLLNNVSLAKCRLIVAKATVYALLFVGTIWLFTLGAVLFAFGALSAGLDETVTVANGAVYVSAFAMALILTVATIAPALLLLQPDRLFRVLREEKAAVTPRQRFRGASCCPLNDMRDGSVS